MSRPFSGNTQADAVEIVYAPACILKKLHDHQLNPKVVFSKLTADIPQLVTLQKSLQQESFLYQLCEAIKNWQPQHDAASFTASINQLIYLWLNAFKHGVKIETLLNILKCFKVQGVTNFLKSPLFHLFIHNLLIESLTSFHEAALDHALYYDENSQLPNEKQLISDLALVLNQAESNQITALFSLHLKIESNHFLLRKIAHQDLNKQLAAILKKNTDSHSQLYFTSDGQFELLIPQVTNTMQLDLLAAKLFRAFETLVFINNQSILIKPFIGSASSTAQTLNAHDVYQHAKLALEYAVNKQLHYVAYSEKLEQIVNDTMTLESNVLAMFDRNNLTMHLQPIIDLKANKCIGAELLLRCADHPQLAVSPETILQILNHVEKKGKLFTHWLINTACRYAHEMVAQHQLDLYLTINLRAEDLYDTELPALFSNALALWKVDPKNIMIEITESGVLEYNKHSRGVIEALSELGFKFALDDFGTGFSSLTRLRTLPIDLIKIDQSFITNIHHSKNDDEIVQSIIMLANGLGKDILAEGVEDEGCLTKLKALNIDKCQGFYFAEAMPYDAFIKWVKAY